VPTFHTSVVWPAAGVLNNTSSAGVPPVRAAVQASSYSTYTGKTSVSVRLLTGAGVGLPALTTGRISQMIGLPASTEPLTSIGCAHGASHMPSTATVSFLTPSTARVQVRRSPLRPASTTGLYPLAGKVPLTPETLP